MSYRLHPPGVGRLILVLGFGALMALVAVPVRAGSHPSNWAPPDSLAAAPVANASSYCPGGTPADELVASLIHTSGTDGWKTFNIDLSGHDWQDDVADGLITLMLTGPQNGDHICGGVDLSESGHVPYLLVNGTYLIQVQSDCGGSEVTWAYICERGTYQAWFAFDLSSLPGGTQINTLTFNAYLYTEETAQRTLWYDSDDSVMRQPVPALGSVGLVALASLLLALAVWLLRRP